MARKTYLIGLFAVMNTAYKYAARWQDQVLENDLSDAQIACFTAIITALAECVQLFRPAPPTP